MKKFPVKIDLSTFFEDERKFVLILVDPQWKSVEYLQRRVEEIFDVRPVQFLTKDNLFIPPQESIEVVEFTESLKAFIPKHPAKLSPRRSKQFSLTDNINNDSKSNKDELPIEEKLVKKRKYYTLGTEFLDSCTPNQTKKSKRTSVAVSMSSAPAPNESQEITSTNEQFSLLKEHKKVQKNRNHDDHNTNSGKMSDTDIVENPSSTPKEGGVTNSISKRKKKRSRKPVSAEQKDYEQDIAEQTGNSITIRTEIPSSTFPNNSKPLGKGSHIYFNDSTIVESSTNKQPSNVNTSIARERNKSPKVIFKCNLNNLADGNPLVFPLKAINKSHMVRRPIIEIQENILLPPADIDILTKTAHSKELSTPITTEIKNDSEIETKEERNQSDNDNEITVKEEEIPTEKAIEQKGTHESNHSRDELACDENNSHNEATNINANESQESSAITTTNASKDSGASVNSLALDESCVIDLDDDEEDVIDLSDADDQRQSLRSNTNLLEAANKSISAMSVDEMLPFCTPLTSIPAVGDTVVFKFNREALGEKMDISEFIACKCEHINRRTKVLKLALIDARLEKDNIPQHYIYNLDESLDNKFMSIKFPEMIDAKVLEA